MDLISKYPLIEYLQEKAAKRMPNVALTYLNCGTGDDRGVQRNIEGLNRISLVPQFMKGEITPILKTKFLGHEYDAPFGMAPVGLGGLMWPKVENIMAKTANQYKVPYCLSTVATETPEMIGPIVGDMGWFQLYPPRKRELRDDILKRAKDNGFHTLVVTVDVPTPSRREKSIKSGLSMPPKITSRFLYQALTHPQWTIATLKRGLPKLRTMQKYVPSGQTGEIVQFVSQNLGGNLSWDYIKEVRDLWDGPIILKGILHPSDAEKSVAIGCDGIGVSNHGARQFNGSKAAIDLLPDIVNAVKGKAAIVFDGGIRSGLDIIRALSMGADFVLLGRAFLWGVAAVSDKGADLVMDIILADLTNNMIQLGCNNIDEIRQLK